MEEINNLQNQNIPVSSQKNIYKPLFFIFFTFSLISISVLLTLYLTNNIALGLKKNSSIVSTQTAPSTQIISPSIDSVTNSVESTQSSENIENLKKYINTNDKYTVYYSDRLGIRDFGSGVAFRLLSTSNDLANESIIVDKTSRSNNLAEMPFSEYVKIAANLEIEGGYDTVSNIEKITTKNGTIGYKVIWNGHDRRNNKIIHLPITYFDTKNTDNDNIQIRLEKEDSLSEYNKIISNFELN